MNNNKFDVDKLIFDKRNSSIREMSANLALTIEAHMTLIRGIYAEKNDFLINSRGKSKKFDKYMFDKGIAKFGGAISGHVRAIKQQVLEYFIHSLYYSNPNSMSVLSVREVRILSIAIFGIGPKQSFFKDYEFKKKAEKEVYHLDLFKQQTEKNWPKNKELAACKVLFDSYMTYVKYTVRQMAIEFRIELS